MVVNMLVGNTCRWFQMPKNLRLLSLGEEQLRRVNLCIFREGREYIPQLLLAIQFLMNGMKKAISRNASS